MRAPLDSPGNGRVIPAETGCPGRRDSASLHLFSHSLRAGRNGVMPAFEGTLSEDKIHILTAYVYGLGEQ